MIRTLFGKQIEKISEVLPLISVVSIVMIISGIVAINAEKIVSCGVLVLIVVAIHNLCGMGLGLLAAKIFHIEYSKATAIAIEVGMQNSGLAVSLATANFATSPLATLPGAIFSVWHNISGSVFAGIRRKGLDKSRTFTEMTCMDVGNNAIFNDLIPDLDHGSEVVFCVLLSCDIHCILLIRMHRPAIRQKIKLRICKKTKSLLRLFVFHNRG